LKLDHPIVQIFDNKLTLDVGGELFRITVEVLNAEESLFTSMFSGRILVEPDPFDGSFFVDRSPQYFNYIVEYLRYGKIRGLKSINKWDKDGILIEANFYELNGLVELLGGKKRLKSSVFEYEMDWDENGLFHSFKDNKSNAPKILITRGTSSDGHYTITTSNSCEYNISQEKASEILGANLAWSLCSPTSSNVNNITVDLGQDNTFSVDAVTCSCSYSSSSYFVNCDLLGSNDNTHWTIIIRLKVGTTKITSEVKPYRYFRLQNGSSQTLCSGWEMYGSL